MKFNDLFLLSEALSDNKELMRKLEVMWSPTIPKDEIIDYVRFFELRQNQLKPTIIGKVYNPETGQQEDKDRPMVPVVKFLKRFPNFEEKDLRQIDKYSAEQIIYLKSEIEKKTFDTEQNIFTVNPERNPSQPKKLDLSTNDRKVEASKELWFNSRNNAIINEGGVRVYRITSQLESISYGYYLEALPKLYPNNPQVRVNQWCVTWANDNNAYMKYRTQDKRVFYFIIDDNKNPQKLKEEGDNSTIGGLPKGVYYLSTLQIDSNGSYILTPTSNGEPRVTIDFILSVYPQLREHMDKIIYNPADESERYIKSNKIMLTEAPVGFPQEFAYAPHNQQLDYINDGGILTKAKSWEHLDSEGRKAYMRRMNQNTYSMLFSTYELLAKIEESISDTKTFNFYLNQFKPNDTLTTLLGKTLVDSGQFKIYRRSVENPNLELWISADNNNFGIYDTSKKEGSQFYKRDNITYKPQYVLSEEIYYEDEDGNGFHVKYFTLYRKDNTVNLKESFYVVTELGKENAVPAHFYTYDNFQKLVKDFSLEENPYGPGSAIVKKAMFAKNDKENDVEPEEDGDVVTATKLKKDGWSTADIAELLDL